MAGIVREERLQIMLSPEELALVDDFRFKYRMPSRAAAVRELLKIGIASAEQVTDATGTKSANFGVFGRGAQGHQSNPDGSGNDTGSNA